MVADLKLDTAEWRVSALSVTGAKHRERGVGCDDYVASRTLSNGWIVVALSDGAGSAAAAALGARTAVDAALAVFEIVADRIAIADEAERRALISECFAGVSGAISQTAEAAERPVTDLNATLTIALLAPDEIIAAQVGDGAAVVRGAGGEAETLLLPDCGEHLTETVFVTLPVAPQRLQIASAKGARSVAFFTDGLQLSTLKIADWSPYQPFFENVFDYFASVEKADLANEALESLLNSEKLAKASDDDLTLGVATIFGATAEQALTICRTGHIPSGWSQPKAKS